MESFINQLNPISAKCAVVVPPQDQDPYSTISRWSNTNIQRAPACVVRPATESDILAVLEFARKQNLKVIPASGAHGTFVPIDCNCIYLDMQGFKSIVLDENKRCVTLAGGVLADEVLRSLSERGYYTCVPNSNAVGMVGFVFGGGSSTFNGLHGLAIDNLLSMRIITATGKIVETGPGSTGPEGELFNVLCGAGYGFGIVPSITLRAWPIRELKMLEKKAWVRRLIFPPPAISAAAELFTRLQSPDPELTVVLLFARAPPSAPKPGAPVIMLLLTYLGAADAAEKACPAAFDPDLTAKAIVAVSTTAAFENMNDAAEPLNRHGDFKENYAVWSHSLTASAIESAFNQWVQFGEGTPSAKLTSYFVIAAKSTKGMLEHDKDGNKFFPRTIRERNVFVQVAPWWKDPADEAKARAWAEGMLETLGPTDGERVKGFAANLHKWQDMGEIYSDAQIERIERLKGAWDPEDMFWNPVVNGL